MTTAWQEPARHRAHHEAATAFHLTIVEGGGQGLMVTDLMNDFPTLVGMLVEEVGGGHWLDAFLLAAGAGQVLEDHLQGASAPAVRGAAHLSKLRGPAAVTTGAAMAWTRAAVRTGQRQLAPRQRTLGRLTEMLAAVALEGSRPDAALLSQLEALTSLLAAGLADIPEPLRHQVMRPPSSFRSFDQRPSDMESLTRLFAERWPRRDRPVAVVGVRTSGSYLAPLCAAALRAEGFSRVQVTTLRPACGLTRGARQSFANLVAAGGVAALVDDPPTTGSTLCEAIAVLKEAGVPRRSVAVMLAHFDPQPEMDLGVPKLNRIDLEWSQWAVHRQLTPDAVASSMRRLLSPRLEVLGAEAVGPPSAVLRGHARGRFRLLLHDRRAGLTAEEDVVVEGAGLGYLGRQSLAVARALPGYVPTVFGFEEGLLYRRWLPESDRVRWIADPEGTARGIARYTATRARALPAKEDHSLRAAGCQPVWEVASSILARPMGRPGLPLRTSLVDPVVKDLLRVDQPAIPDGRTDPRWWFKTAGSARAGRLTKVGFAEGSFSHLDLANYDPVFDLAGASASTATPGLGRALLAAYREESGEEVSHERWLIHELVQLWDLRRRGQRWPEEADAASARALQRYLSTIYLSGLSDNGASAGASAGVGGAARIGDGIPPGAGPGKTPWCAIDLDGVLETSPMGFPASTRAGMEALRSLLAHGYRPLLATGRSLADVKERCASYGLAGGVAEYGAVTYCSRDGVVTDLLPPGGAEALQALRQHLEGLQGVRVDTRHRYSVRAWHIRPGGKREPLEDAVIDKALAASGAAPASGAGVVLRMVPGLLQTDFTVEGVDKGGGLRHLLAQMTGGAPAATSPLALAVGDSASDLAMLALAEVARAPSNADQAVRSSQFRLTPSAYQAGLRQAVGDLVGHAPGACPACRPPSLTPGTRALVALLSVHEAGTRGMAPRLARLWATTRCLPGSR